MKPLRQEHHPRLQERSVREKWLQRRTRQQGHPSHHVQLHQRPCAHRQQRRRQVIVARTEVSARGAAAQRGVASAARAHIQLRRPHDHKLRSRHLELPMSPATLWIIP